VESEHGVRESTESREPELILPDGGEAVSEGHPRTERSRQRSREDQEFVPVVIKRTDESVRHPDDTLEAAIAEGLEQLNRRSLSLALSAIAGGIAVGLSAMAVAVVTQAMMPLDSPVLTRLATAFVYPLGFVICVMSGAQLYTEHTATAVYPVLDRRASVKQLLRLWVIVITGNLIGTGVIALLLTGAGEVLQAGEGFIDIGRYLVGVRTGPLLISGILAGMLMAQGAWLILSTTPEGSQLASIYIVTFLIGLGGFHHSIAGAAEMLTALFISNEFAVYDAGRFIVLALLGNLIGGSIFVGVLNYAHIRKTQQSS
jgi:formate/nitrite transporter FocA (FNT family)